MIPSSLRQGHIYQRSRLKPTPTRISGACPMRQTSSVWISPIAPSRGMSLLLRHPRSPHPNLCSPYRVPSQALLRPLSLRSSTIASRSTTLTLQPPPSSPPRAANPPKPQPQQPLPAPQGQATSPSAQTPPSLSIRPLRLRMKTTTPPASPAPTVHAPSALSDPAVSPHT